MSVHWATLFPHEFKTRLHQQPVVFLPMGLCEPHGPGAVFGLDTIKAEYLCVEGATRNGGIVAPTQGYQIHESGFHAPWLNQVIGDSPAFMTSMPPHIILYFFLYQLRCFHNAGFKAAIIITGHAGGNQIDLRHAAKLFSQHSDMVIKVFADPELVNGKYVGDHAGKYEISQLLFIQKEFIDMARVQRTSTEDILNRFAQGNDATDASADLGKEIIEACLDTITKVTLEVREAFSSATHERVPMTYDQVEHIWRELKVAVLDWVSVNPHEGNELTAGESTWHSYQRPSIYHDSNNF